MVYAPGRTREPVVNRPTPKADRKRFCLSDADVLELAGAAIKIEDHYSRRPASAGRWTSNGPRTAPTARSTSCRRGPRRRPRALGDAAGGVRARRQRPGAGQRPRRRRAHRHRPVRRVTDARHLAAFKPGEVLVADTTTPDWEPVMKTAAAIVTNRGGRTCHAAIVARELGIPAVVGAEGATEQLAVGQVVTVSCAEGAVGKVYDGALPFRREVSDVSGLVRPKTEIMVNLGNPELAFQTALMPCDGVGLARMEFIINEHIKVHPMAVLHPERIVDAAVRAQVQALWAGHPDGASYFVERLAEGVGTIAAAFWPRPVIVRLSDFKSNEYAALLGGRDFEPHEENPMIGFRGAARYIHPAYAEAFALECRGDEARARGHGPDQPEADGALLPPAGRGARRAGGDGGARPGARRPERARGLRDVRDPEQRAADRRVQPRCSTASRSAATTSRS
jgi:pyruvate,water dikinase